MNEVLQQFIFFFTKCIMFLFHEIILDNEKWEKLSGSPWRHRFCCPFFGLLHFCCASLRSVIMSPQFSLTDQAGKWRSREWGGRWYCCLTPLRLLEGEKKPICVLLLTSVSQRENLQGTPSALHLSIVLAIHASLYHPLPSSNAFLLIMLQGFSPHRDTFMGKWDDNPVK